MRDHRVAEYSTESFSINPSAEVRPDNTDGRFPRYPGCRSELGRVLTLPSRLRTRRSHVRVVLGAPRHSESFEKIRFGFSASLIVRLLSDATHGNRHLLQALRVPTQSLSTLAEVVERRTGRTVVRGRPVTLRMDQSGHNPLVSARRRQSQPRARRTAPRPQRHMRHESSNASSWELYPGRGHPESPRLSA